MIMVYGIICNVLLVTVYILASENFMGFSVSFAEFLKVLLAYDGAIVVRVLPYQVGRRACQNAASENEKASGILPGSRTFLPRWKNSSHNLNTHIETVNKVMGSVKGIQQRHLHIHERDVESDPGRSLQHP